MGINDGLYLCKKVQDFACTYVISRVYSIEFLKIYVYLYVLRKKELLTACQLGKLNEGKKLILYECFFELKSIRKLACL